MRSVALFGHTVSVFSQVCLQFSSRVVRHGFDVKELLWTARPREKEKQGGGGSPATLSSPNTHRSGLVRKLYGYGGRDRDRVRGHFGSSRVPYPWLQCPFACSSLSQLPSAATLCFGNDLMVFESRSWFRLLRR